MSFYEKFKTFDQKFPWSFSGVVIAIIIFVVTLWITFGYEKRPKISFQILSEAPVYDIKEEVSKLDILFEGEDIRKKDQTLSIITLRVINLGSAAILKNSFDEQNPPALIINECRIIKLDLVDANNDYLRSSAKFTPAAENRFLLSPVILDPDDFVIFKFLLIHGKSKPPKLEVVGKISGCKKIEISNMFTSAAEPSLWTRIVGGNLLVQLWRIPVYFGGTIILAFLFLIIPSITLEKWRTSRRKKHVKKFKEYTAYDFSPGEEALLQEYVNRGENFLILLQELTTNQDRLNSIFQKIQSESTRIDHVRYDFPLLSEPLAVDFLLKNKLVTFDTDGAKFDKNTAARLQQFLLFISAVVPGMAKLTRRKSAPFGTESNEIKDEDLVAAVQSVKRAE